MHTKARKRLLLALFLSLAILIGLPVWSVCRQVRQERLNRDLIVAIKINDTTAAVAALRDGADANTEDKGDSPVSARQVLRAWWDRMRGRKPAASAYRPSALIVASEIYEQQQDGSVTPPENVAVFQALLDHGADLNARGEDGNTALILAAFYDHAATARLLLDHGADLNARDEDGDTALMRAAYCDHAATARLLLDRGAEVNAVDMDGLTALMFAYSYYPTGMIELLLERGAQVNTRDRDGKTALMWACSGKCYRRGLERLLVAGAQINARDKRGQTALMYAAGNKDIVRWLKQHGARK